METVSVWDRDAKKKEFKNWTKNKKSQLKDRHKQKEDLSYGKKYQKKDHPSLQRRNNHTKPNTICKCK